MNARHDVGAVAQQFAIAGMFRSAEPYGSGHINDSYCAVFDDAGRPVRAIIQRVNHHIFRNPPALMENIERVTAHLAAKVANDPERERRVLRLIPTRAGQTWLCDAEGNFWRAYRFIERAQTYDAIETGRQAYEAAKAFGRFQQMLADLPAPRLHDTIPDFHHTPKRFAALEHAITADAAGRVKGAQAEIGFALERKAMTGVLLDAALPERVTHNDTKLNNVMLDEATGEGICVVDLDTVMPGLAHYDFGDMVRTSASTAAEDERDLKRMEMSFPMFEAVARGYLAEAGAFLTREERSLLAFSGRLITFEIAIRFLTDHLNGDTYFKVHREGHNLDRARAQFRLVETMEVQQRAMERLIAEWG
ncbi:MAG TPA: aminoglycoside phosphotransferase family protein [Terracidiphilus sp.]|nr:aminoglycoside phosphotransferase family protein [Terracidiphilus sp.]